MNASIRNLLEGQLGEIWVEGELSNCKVWNTGHMYLTLKDDSAQVRGVMFRMALRYLRFTPKDGLRVVARDVHHFGWSTSPDYRYEGGWYLRTDAVASLLRVQAARNYSRARRALHQIQPVRQKAAAENLVQAAHAGLGGGAGLPQHVPAVPGGDIPRGDEQMVGQAIEIGEQVRVQRLRFVKRDRGSLQGTVLARAWASSR